MMKILLANKFYYMAVIVLYAQSGKALKAHGHEVAVFAIDYPENLERLANTFQRI